MADTCIGARLESGPARLIFDLLVALPGPVPDALDPDNLSQVRDRVRAACFARAAGPGQARDQVPGGRVAGPTVGTTSRRAPSGPHLASVASAANQVWVCPPRKPPSGCQSPGLPAAPG
jgi:hypothetical protein